MSITYRDEKGNEGEHTIAWNTLPSCPTHRRVAETIYPSSIHSAREYRQSLVVASYRKPLFVYPPLPTAPLPSILCHPFRREEMRPGVLVAGIECGNARLILW